MWDAIKRLVVRGAPAIGVAAAFGVYLGIRNVDSRDFTSRLNDVCEYLKSSRPTAVNLAWAVDRVRRAGDRDAILRECVAMLEEDKQRCRAIGEHGCEVLRSIKPSGTINLL